MATMMVPNAESDATVSWDAPPVTKLAVPESVAAGPEPAVGAAPVTSTAFTAVSLEVTLAMKFATDLAGAVLSLQREVENSAASAATTGRQRAPRGRRVGMVGRSQGPRVTARTAERHTGNAPRNGCCPDSRARRCRAPPADCRPARS